MLKANAESPNYYFNNIITIIYINKNNQVVKISITDQLHRAYVYDDYELM